jgi:hypothetical protein
MRTQQGESLFAMQSIRNLYAEITLIQKALMLFCVATNKCATEVKGGPMFGIAVMFLVSTVVLMALSAVEG